MYRRKVFSNGVSLRQFRTWTTDGTAPDTVVKWGAVKGEPKAKGAAKV